MTSLPINLIPAGVLDRFDVDQIVLICNDHLGDKVFGTTTFDPSAMREVEGLEAFSELRRREEVYSITTTVMRLTESAVFRATKGLDERERIVTELGALLRRLGAVYIVYAITHFNHKPLEELNVFIGGDCYRKGGEVKDLETLLSRIKDLAKAMIRKTVIVFPDIPTLHGGKKGEWLIVDREGRKIEEISDEAIVALGTLIIPEGISFLNRYKEREAVEKGIYSAFPDRNVMRPDTASPDVLSGPNWTTMCNAWAERGVDMSLITCLPDHLGGPLVPSAYPTGYGVVATALKLVEHYFHDRNRAEIKFLLEALGGVGQATVRALLERGISPSRIFAFDKSMDACKRVTEQYGISATASSHEEFYRMLDRTQTYDVWINNGEGANTRPEHVRKLIDCGIRLFCGAANNFLQLTDEKGSKSEDLRLRSLQMIFDAGAWAWPDEAASGGGWTLAVIDVLTRAKGERSNTKETERQILETIIARNEKLVDDVVREVSVSGNGDGKAVWDKVGHLIDERVQLTLRKQFLPSEILAAADVTQWKLT